jgi:SAM-dependent methyltransferase
LDKGIRVLDAGCGGGTWILVSISARLLVVHTAEREILIISPQPQEMANEYPSSEFTGVDISVGWPTEIRPRNSDFVVGNIVNELPFEDNTFDFVYMRLVGMGISNDEYPIVLSHIYRVLKPGGWIELVEVRFRALRLTT